MIQIATLEDKRFVFLRDIDGNDSLPVFVGEIVSLINSGQIGGFVALSDNEIAVLDWVLRHAEHLARATIKKLFSETNSSEEWKTNRSFFSTENEALAQMASYRHRLNLPDHPFRHECCELQSKPVNEGIGL